MLPKCVLTIDVYRRSLCSKLTYDHSLTTIRAPRSLVDRTTKVRAEYGVPKLRQDFGLVNQLFKIQFGPDRTVNRKGC